MDWNERIIPTSRSSVISDNIGLNNYRGFFGGIIWYFLDRGLFNWQRIQLITLNHSWVMDNFFCELMDIHCFSYSFRCCNGKRRKYLCVKEMINDHLFQSNIFRVRSSFCWLIREKLSIVNYLMFTFRHRSSSLYMAAWIGRVFQVDVINSSSAPNRSFSIPSR